MMRRAVRLALLALFLAAMGVTAYLFWMADRENNCVQVYSPNGTLIRQLQAHHVARHQP